MPLSSKIDFSQNKLIKDDKHVIGGTSLNATHRGVPEISVLGYEKTSPMLTKQRGARDGQGQAQSTELRG